MLSPEAYLTAARALFREAGKPDVAQGQMAYMRNQFEFFGLKMPAWKALTKSFLQENGLPEGENLKNLVRLCFEDEHRELHYFAITCVEKSIRKQPADFIYFLEEMIDTRSWWDSVDWINKLVGIHFQRYPELIVPVTERWLDSGNMWLQRVCLIFQLAYKENTDQELLFEYIRRLSGSKAFFIQKAAGWALRDYSKRNPTAVRAFIDSTPLPALTVREGGKYC